MTWDAAQIFEDELTRRGLAFRRASTGEYEVRVAGGEVSVSIENRRRDAERDDDPDAMRRLVAEVLAIQERADHALRPWPEVRGDLLLSVDARAHDLAGVVAAPLTDEVASIVTLTDTTHSRVTWVTDSMREGWGIEVGELRASAAANQDSLLEGIELEVQRPPGIGSAWSRSLRPTRHRRSSPLRCGAGWGPRWVGPCGR